MILNIIITHYKEPWETCWYLLNSLAMQRNVLWKEVGVTIVNDGDDTTLDDVDWNAYPFNVKYLKKGYGGISAARNYGLDNSEAEYIMFCDIDDGFLNNYGLHMLLSAVAEGFDFLIGAFAEEAISTDDKTIALVGHQGDLTFVHGKVYNREFLKKYNLRFDDSMTIHEDGYFNALVYSTAKAENAKIRKVETPFYLWCWNNNSTVRSNKEDFVLRTYSNVMQARIGLCRQLKQRGYTEEYEVAVAMTVLNSYYDFQKPSYWTAKNDKHRKAAEKEFRKFWMEFKKTFYGQSNLKIAEIAKASRETATNNGMLMERQDIKTWIKHIEYEVNA